MRRIHKLGVAIAVVALIGSVRETRAEGVPGEPEPIFYVPVEGLPSVGPKDALVTIVEFSDFYCGYCRRANRTLRQLRQLYPDDIRVVFAHMPLDPEDGTLPARATIAASRQGKFWAMHDRLFGSPPVRSREQLVDYAYDLGLDVPRFVADMTSTTSMTELLSNLRLSGALEVSSTPTFFFNGRKVSGALGFAAFNQLVEEESARVRKLVASGTARNRVYETIMRRAKRGASVPASVPASATDGDRYVVPVGPNRSHRMGPDTALVTIVEFSDFECHFCGRLQGTLRQLRQRYGNDLRVVYRHLPLGFHPHAQLAAEAAVEAGEQGQFEAYHNLLMGNQRALTRRDLEGYASSLKLDMEAFGGALDTRKHLRTVLSDVAAAGRVGARGTPQMFVNGVAVGGAKPFDIVQPIVDSELARARQLLANGVTAEQVYDAAMRSGGNNEPKLISEYEFAMAVAEACKAGKGSSAALLLERVRDVSYREIAVRECKKHGVNIGSK